MPKCYNKPLKEVGEDFKKLIGKKVYFPGKILSEPWGEARHLIYIELDSQPLGDKPITLVANEHLLENIRGISDA